MNPFEHELWLASAGTGKTYRLTNRFLALLIAGVEPERILATTFTRKAAGEILDRVLERLVAAAEGGEGLEGLRAAMEDPALDAERCRALLERLTRSLDSFQVRTIDSFFAHLVRLFALDLDLPPDWAIADTRETAALQLGAVQDLLAQGDPAELVALLRDLQRGEGRRAVQASLLDRARKLRPLALEAAEGAWSVLQDVEAPDPATLEDELARVEAAPIALTGKGAPHKSWVTAREKLLALARSGDWENLFDLTLVQNAASDEPKFSRKPIEPEMVEALLALRDRAGREILRALGARNEAAHSLLSSFEACYVARTRQSSRYDFDDLPLALAPGAARGGLFEEREAELWFRLDSRLDHLLLDEFQDTSPIQWRILRPLAEELVATGGEPRSFFCVGDVKQSIYGFRQAEPRLLAKMSEMLPGLREQTMQQSRRSSQIVLDVVNHVFDGVDGNASLADEDFAAHRVAAADFASRFEVHDAFHAHPGAAYVLEARESAEGESKGAPCLELAVERVEAILDECPHAEVGVLVRTNKQIPLLIHQLRERGVDASGEGGSELTDSEAVLVFLSLLHLADHPEDRAAAFHVATSRFADYLELPRDGAGKVLRGVARRVRERLQQRGLGELAATLGKAVAADEAWSAWDKARFAQLVDRALAFEARSGLRASEFVDQIRAERVEAPGGSRVRVMTVHASKGLEFDAVVLPELDASLVGQGDSYLIDRPDPAGPIEAIVIKPKQAHCALSPRLQSMYDGARTRAVANALCTLYVAMTRAKRRLDLVLTAQNPESKAKTPTYARLVRAALAPHGLGEADEDGVLWSLESERPWHEGLREELLPPAPARAALELAPTTTPRATARRAASAEEGGSTVRAASLLASRAGASVGSLVHAVFEDCEWIEDFEYEASKLDGSGAAPDLVESARSIVGRALEAPAVREALSRSACAAPEGTELEVLRERPFSVLLEDREGESHWRGAIDRLVLARRDGEAVWAEVVDYKSDRVEEGELEERVAFYRPQLEAYARVVAAQTGLQAHAVHLRLVFLSLGRVVDLTPES